MGTRGGDVDPGVLLFLMRELGLSAGDVDRILNKESGLLGVSGVSNDMRDVSANAAAGDERCRLALEIYAYRLKKYVGAFAAVMGGLDALVFTAGVGENNPQIRAAVCEGLSFLGIELGRGAQRRRTGSRVRHQRGRVEGARLGGAHRRGAADRRRDGGRDSLRTTGPSPTRA